MLGKGQANQIIYKRLLEIIYMDVRDVIKQYKSSSVEHHLSTHLLIECACKDVELCAKHYSEKSTAHYDCQAL